MGENLLPCPFCGNEARTSTYETESLWSHDQVTYTKVFCDQCDVSFESEPGYELEAPAAWNRRPAPMEAVAWREKVSDAVLDACRQYADISRAYAGNRLAVHTGYILSEAADAIQALAVIPTQGGEG